MIGFPTFAYIAPLADHFPERKEHPFDTFDPLHRY